MLLVIINMIVMGQNCKVEVGFLFELQFFPKTEKYVSLFIGGDDTDIVDRRNRLRKEIKANIIAAAASGKDLEGTFFAIFLTAPCHPIKNSFFWILTCVFCSIIKQFAGDVSIGEYALLKLYIF